MRKHALVLLAVSALSIGPLVGRAHAIFVFGDPQRLNGPGIASGGALDAMVAVRKSDGTIWRKFVEPSLGSWASLGSPPGGAASGPAVAARNNSYYTFVRGTDNKVWYTTGGGTWTSVFGFPPAGVASAPSVASVGASPNVDILVGVIDGNNVPQVRRMHQNGSFDPWTQVGVNSAMAVPGVALNTVYSASVYTLDGNGNTIFSRCTFGSCWSPWASFGPGVANEGLSAVGYYSPQSGLAQISVVVRGTDNIPWVAKSTDDGASFGGFVQLGGSATNAAPAIAWFSPANRTLVVSHRADGNFYIYGFHAGAWDSIGHP